jgi:hypothetical protein
LQDNDHDQSVEITIKGPNNMNKVMKIMVAVTCLFVGTTMSQAATITWDGGGLDGFYKTGANWDTNTVPNSTDTAIINSGAVNYVAPGDLFVGSLQINGGSFIQTGGNSWMQFNNSSLIVNGGSFSQGTADAFVNNTGTTVQILSGSAAFAVTGGGVDLNTGTGAFTLQGGTTSFGGNLVFNTGGNLVLSSGATLNVLNEFKPIANYTVSAGTLNAKLIAFADGPGALNLSGGNISVNGTATANGIYPGAGTTGVNFTTGSTGVLFVSNIDLTTFNSTNMMNDGRIKLNGASNAGAFTLTALDGGVYVSLPGAAPVPEPSTYALLVMGAVSLFALRRFRKA